MDVIGYLTLLQNAIPEGLAWTRAPLAFMTRLLTAIAKEFARIDARARNLPNEADPRETVELIDDWERFAGLPDICVTKEQSLQERQVALSAKLRMQGGQNAAYFIQIASDLGYEGATVDHKFMELTCNDDCNDELHSPDDKYTWVMNLPSDGGFYQMDAESPCDNALASWGDEAIECRINRYSPSHTTIIFAYTGP